MVSREHEEVNTNFDVNDVSKPLWRTTMVVHRSVACAYGKSMGIKEEEAAWCAGWEEATLSDQGSQLDASTVTCSLTQEWVSTDNKQRSQRCSPSPLLLDPTREDDPRQFEMISSFDHCLGDGLSMYTFAKSF